ncbi:MAG: hypothetical protein IIB12_03545 [Chloroflexi bacterium]|nr:hypothetical protein [Chloroflexota bacterium]
MGLKIDEEHRGVLSLNARGALSGDGDEEKPISEVTFKDVFMSDKRSLAVRKEREALLDAADKSKDKDEGDSEK